jgi:methionine-rich copper-binding protein CopC
MSLPAQAHAYLVDSFPAAKQRLHAPLKTVKLRFSGRADAHYSTISLLREDGAVLATRTQPKAQREFDLPAPPLEPGRYRVHYRILCRRRPCPRRTGFHRRGIEGRGERGG